MSTSEAMIANIIENPQDDGPRLVYADWLEEQGRCDRAEFIRVQVELGNVVEPHVCGFDHGARACWVCRLRRRADALLAANEAEWMRQELEIPLDKSWSGSQWIYSADGPQIKLTWHRGFVSQVECRLADFAGETCGRCGGSGDEDLSREPCSTATTDCRKCHGIGRTSGLGTVLLRRAPIERVVVTDKEPSTWPLENLFEHHHDDFVWTVRTDNQIEIPGDLPRNVFDQLKGGEKNAGNWNCRYRSADAARAALSAALIKLAREQMEPKEIEHVVHDRR